MTQKLTILDIARISGYSKSTVSRVLRNESNVSESARAAIQAVIEETHFVRNAVASSMVKGSQRILMIIVGDISNYFYSAAVKEIEKQLHEYGYLAVVCNSEYSAEKELSYVDMAGSFRLAGVVLMSPIESDALRDALNKMDCPILVMNRRLADVHCDSLVQDNFRCAYLATEHLIRQGHKRILHISSGTKASTSVERHAGYLEAMQYNKLPVAEDLVLFGDLTWEAGVRLANKILEEQRDYTAVFIDNDMMTVGFVNAWKRTGKRIPEDISLICFDTSPYLDSLSTPISTVGSSGVEIGSKAADMLLYRLRHPNSSPRWIMLEPRIELRDSTCGAQKTPVAQTTVP